MTIRVAIRHTMHYRYDQLVAATPHVLRLRPAPHCRTTIESYALRIEPAAHFLNWQQDPYGNFLARVVFPERLRELVIDVELVAELRTVNPFDFFLDEDASHYPITYEERLAKALAPYRERTEPGPLLRAWLAEVSAEKCALVDFLVGLNQRLQRDIGYAIRLEPGVQTPEETLERRIGSCRDSAWLLVVILRHLGFASRFVSGYSVQLVPDEPPPEGAPPGPTTDATDLHAWAEVFAPGAGWIGLDPTSGLLAAEGHIPLAATPGPSMAAALEGGTSPSKVTFEHRNEVTRLLEDPRVTRPYDDGQWAAIRTLGRAVDQALVEGDVRLTMGGEPTFVARTDREAGEWNHAADGPNKRRLSRELARRLRDRFAPGGLLHQGQGKWYPGEPLPRWAYSIFWRRDGVPVWERPDQIAWEDGGEVALEHAEAMIEGLARRFELPTDCVIAAYEDPFVHLHREAQLPPDADLASDAGRRALVAKLDADLGQPVGWVLPLDRSSDGSKWNSCRWRFRRDQLFLLPGDSPMGYRLPLGSVTDRDTALREREREVERSPLEPAPILPPRDTTPRSTPGVAHEALVVDDVRTAVSTEIRDGRLCVFLPPTQRLETFLALVDAVEAVATEIGIGVVIEGYPPPTDPRLVRLAVTPDPGVIEVNVPPSASFAELETETEILYAETRAAGLASEKFLLDGRHTGTGGGNHITLGGPTPADSAFLRRPDLLASLITYWQHHPGLSYLFSGMFLGPTSQAPRIDEGRDEQLYELEIALGQLPEGEVPEPWIVDRLFRHLLIDVTGNTHRAEFCIDKLYSPDSWSGRLGLVELRAFEMPPHERMSLVQMLLLRALVARFWREPYRRPLVRWGTELHDRFLLPHDVEADLTEVTRDLAEAGFPFDPAWLAPFFEFRFPRYGTVRVREVELELRMALEPWHVLGEEVTGQGTARFVDSSVERLQVRATGLTSSRYAIAVNGRRVPLRSTGTRGEVVGGVRYRAWQPPSCLHPTIGVHAPLVFDVIDTWNRRAVGGCTYHVSHPGGRSYETIPVNAAEAEARRGSRFWEHGHRLGPMEAPPLEPNPEYPCTLDLRRRPPD